MQATCSCLRRGRRLRYARPSSPVRFSNGMTATRVVCAGGSKPSQPSSTTPAPSKQAITTARRVACRGRAGAGLAGAPDIGDAASGATAALTAVTGATKRYPRPGTVSMKVGVSEESPSAVRTLRTSVFRPESKSIMTFGGHNAAMISSRRTKRLGCVTNRARRSSGRRSSLTSSPRRRSSNASRSSSKSPKRYLFIVAAVP